MAIICDLCNTDTESKPHHVCPKCYAAILKDLETHSPKTKTAPRKHSKRKKGFLEKLLGIRISR